MLELFILANLMIGPCHGYEIKKILKSANVNNNTLYPLLRNLQIQGYVTMEVQAQDNKPARKVYSITEAGKERLVEIINDFDEVKALSNDEFYIRVAFFNTLPAECIKSILDAREKALNNYPNTARIMSFLDSFPDKSNDLHALHDFVTSQVNEEKNFVADLRKKHGL